VQEPTSTDGTPAARVAELVELVGRDEVVGWCADLLAGRVAHDDPDLPPLAWLGGRATRWLLGLDGDQLQTSLYWVRVWGARGLLHCYQPVAARDVVSALGDEHWRVREMAAKVVARHLLGEALPMVADLRADPVPRVRAAADRALVRISEADA
jgi:HEAT repeat protein